MDLNQVIISPHITEKTYELASKNIFTLKVNSAASKVQIKEALKKIYDVKAVRINIIKIQSRQKNKFTRKGRLKSKISGFKKAQVLLKKDQKIPGFETEK